MTWGMHAIAWLELGDRSKAAGDFTRSYQPYVQEPYKVRQVPRAWRFIVSSSSRELNMYYYVFELSPQCLHIIFWKKWSCVEYEM